MAALFMCVCVCVCVYIYIYTYIYIYIRQPSVITLYKSQQSTGNLNDYCLNAIATTTNLH
jgi:hypothetical protein